MEKPNNAIPLKKVTRAQWLILLVILILALAGRLWYIGTMSAHTLTHDETGYSEMTRQLLDKGYLGYYSDKPNAFITPGYPLFLAVIYKAADIITGHQTIPITAVRIVQSLLSVATLFIVFLIGVKTSRAAAGMLAVILLAAYQPALMANTRILTEVLFTFLLTLYVYFVLVLYEKRNLRLHAISGIILAVSVLVRPTLAPLLIVPYLLDFWRNRDWKFARGFIIALLCFCAVMSPWWVRNYIVINKMVVFATESGDPFLRGTDPYDPYDKKGPSVIEKVPEEDQMKVGLERIKEGLRTDPGLWIQWYTVGKFVYMWQDPWGMVKWWLRYYHLIFVVILGWLGVIRAVFTPRLRLLAVIPVLLTALQLAFIPITRYMYPLTPLMIILAAILLIDNSAVEKLKAKFNIPLR